MLFEVRADKHIGNDDRITEFCRVEIDRVVPRYGEQVRRVEFSLKDLNSHKGGVDKSCQVEITLSGHPTIVVEDQATTLEAAIAGAVNKADAALDKSLGRQRDKGPRTSMSGE